MEFLPGCSLLSPIPTGMGGRGVAWWGDIGSGTGAVIRGVPWHLVLCSGIFLPIPMAFWMGKSLIAFPCVPMSLCPRVPISPVPRLGYVLKEIIPNSG